MLARLLYPARWLGAYALMLSGLLIDLDHLLASPIYDPGRCSVGFHPLHDVWPVTIYVAALTIPKVRIVAIGLVVHIGLDALDCRITSGYWFV